MLPLCCFCDLKGQKSLLVSGWVCQTARIKSFFFPLSGSPAFNIGVCQGILERLTRRVITDKDGAPVFLSLFWLPRETLHNVSAQTVCAILFKEER